MNAIGIDVSKGKSTVAILRPYGEIIAMPFNIDHSDEDLKKLVNMIKQLPGESKVVMEYTGTYYESIAQYLYSNGIFVSVVNALLVYGYGMNSLRRAKTDKKDSLKLASYAIDRWYDLVEYIPLESVRRSLKFISNQYDQYIKMQTMLKNNLISLLDSVFPGVNRFFSANNRETDGHEKWVDFALRFWHKDCVAKLSISKFKMRYKSFCNKNGYHYDETKAEEIHNYAKTTLSVLHNDENTRLLITQACSQLNAMFETIATLRGKLAVLASKLPEYETVIDMFGVGKVLAPQLIAEIGDTRRFHSRRAITAYAGLDAPPYQSGTVDVRSRSISKRGSSRLRKTLFQVIKSYLLIQPQDEPVYQFLDKKRNEGKHYYVYMMAAANKFLRIYFARVNEILNNRAPCIT